MPKVTLLQNHIHNREELPAGKTITVSETDADWLIKHEIAAMAKKQSPVVNDSNLEHTKSE